MKRDLLFVVERLAATLDDRRLAIIIRELGIGNAKEAAAPAKVLTSFLRKAEESMLGRVLVEVVILHSTQSQTESAKVLRDAAQVYKVDIEAITAKVKQEFAAKDKAKAAKNSGPKPHTKAAKKPVAA